ncbi:hypothetical protein [Methanococcoides sp. FTZ1]|uniref:hypothetical protein n=1 Tax=Methanococcoides sp. FTZ1 TaxID=3439061 RepID=UPI003F86C306
MTAQANYNYSYDLNNNIFYSGERQIPAYELEENEIGTCEKCQSTILSLSYHEIDDEFIVTGKCSICGNISANIYGHEWNWISEIFISHFFGQTPAQTTEDSELQIPEARKSLKNEDNGIDDLELLNSIPMNQIETIFSPTEIKAMFARAKGEKCVRQYLYNARKKYKTFEDVFGIKIDI